jgi:hypothetical protein
MKRGEFKEPLTNDLYIELSSMPIKKNKRPVFPMLMLVSRLMLVTYLFKRSSLLSSPLAVLVLIPILEVLEVFST